MWHNFMLFLSFIFIFHITSDLQKNWKMSTKNSWAPLTQIPQMLTFINFARALSLSLSPFIKKLQK